MALDRADRADAEQVGRRAACPRRGGAGSTPGRATCTPRRVERRTSASSQSRVQALVVTTAAAAATTCRSRAAGASTSSSTERQVHQQHHPQPLGRRHQHLRAAETRRSPSTSTTDAVRDPGQRPLQAAAARRPRPRPAARRPRRRRPASRGRAARRRPGGRRCCRRSAARGSSMPRGHHDVQRPRPSQRPLVARPRDVGLVQRHRPGRSTWSARAERAGGDPLGQPVGDVAGEHLGGGVGAGEGRLVVEVAVGQRRRRPPRSASAARPMSTRIPSSSSVVAAEGRVHDERRAVQRAARARTPRRGSCAPPSCGRGRSRRTRDLLRAVPGR